ncbi:MAG: ABC transporter permease [Gemmatimonadota bacterium]
MSGAGRDAGPGFLRRLLHSRRQMNADVRTEVRFHMDGVVEELMAAGWSRSRAEREAERRFGDPDRVAASLRAIGQQRLSRERRRDRLGDLRRDVRFAVRSLRREPGLALVALLTLALGVGATTAVFAVVDVALLRPLPYPEGERIVVVRNANHAAGVADEDVSPPDLVDFQRVRAFEALAGFNIVSVMLSGVEQPEMLSAGAVTPDFFRVLGVPPARGRAFAPGEAGPAAPPVAVLGWGAWQRHFGGADAVVGRTIELNGVPVEVIGVMPPGFDVPMPETDVWLPLWAANPELHRASRYLVALARLRPDVPLEAAEEELAGVAAALQEQHPETNQGFTAWLQPARERLVGDARPILLTVLGAVGLVLLLACANVANLLLGRATRRGRELAVRAALGAGLGRLRAQLLTESLVLGFLGGGLGVLLAWAGVAGIRVLNPAELPRAEAMTVDGRVMLFALGLTIGTSLVFGLAPVLAAAGSRGASALRAGTAAAGGGRGGERARRALVSLEVAVSMVLLAGALLLLQSFTSLNAMDPGFRTEGILTAKVSLDGGRYPGNGPKVAYFEALLERLEADPAVASAAVAMGLPLDPAGTEFELNYLREGDPPRRESELPEAAYQSVSPGYFETLGMPLLQGRDFTLADDWEAPRVAVINEAFADHLWPGENPIGRRFRTFYGPERDMTVIGVVGDTRHMALATPPAHQYFVPVRQTEFMFGYMSVAMHVVGNAAGLESRARAIAAGLDPAEPMYGFRTMETLRADALARERSASLVFGAFGLLALVMAATGLYGVVSYQVARRTGEIGVRMALGADRTRVRLQVVGQALGVAGMGVAVGTMGALAATRLLSGMLYGVEPGDPRTLGAGALVLLLVAASAAWMPARRASAVSPVEALREG